MLCSENTTSRANSGASRGTVSPCFTGRRARFRTRTHNHHAGSSVYTADRHPRSAPRTGPLDTNGWSELASINLPMTARDLVGSGATQLHLSPLFFSTHFRCFGSENYFSRGNRAEGLQRTQVPVLHRQEKPDFGLRHTITMLDRHTTDTTRSAPPEDSAYKTPGSQWVVYTANVLDCQGL
jgi:hypothetical protein